MPHIRALKTRIKDYIEVFSNETGLDIDEEEHDILEEQFVRFTMDAMNDEGLMIACKDYFDQAEND